MSADFIIEARDVFKHFPVSAGLFGRKGLVKAVDGVSFGVPAGTTFGIAGESGCGKSTIAKLILSLETPSNGQILFDGQALDGLSKTERRRYRRSVQAVFQDPFSSLSPRMRVWEIIAEPILVAERRPRRAIAERVAELLEMVGLPAGVARRYPHEFSGGQRQRIAIARALALNPSVLVLDEPLSALDVSVRAQIVNLLRDLQRKLDLSYILISHDLAVLGYMSDRIGVMYLGRMVEEGESDAILKGGRHPYTQALLVASQPVVPGSEQPDVEDIGELPSPLSPPPGCGYHPRCPVAIARCSAIAPTLDETASGHFVACHL